MTLGKRLVLLALIPIACLDGRPALALPFAEHGTPPDTAQLAPPLSPWFLGVAILLCLALGALHALEPGHTPSPLLRPASSRRAWLPPLLVTGSHTAAVFGVGIGLLYASHFLVPMLLYPWLGMLSGLVVAMLGGYLLLQRLPREVVEHRHGTGELHAHWFQPASLSPVSFSPAAHGATGASPASQWRGLLPYPAALSVLLSAFALHSIGAGLLLITAFGAGLAVVVTTAALTSPSSSSLSSSSSFTSLSSTSSSSRPEDPAVRHASVRPPAPRTRRWLAAASAATMVALGLLVALHALIATHPVWHGLSQEQVGPALFVAGLGLVLGIRHSTDADHVVAISTIVTRQRSMRGAALIGTLWGLGHTITIFIVGCLIILGGVVIPPRIGLSMEFSVGLMLILLGVLNLSGLMGRIVSRLTPSALPGSSPQGQPGRAGRVGEAVGRHGAYQLLRPLVIGLVHGLAGSAAVALLVLSTIHNPLWAIVYLVIFGAGTMFGMMCMTAAMSLPLVYAGDRLPQVSRYLGVASGLVSLCFGTFLVYQLGYGDGLFTGHPHWTPQ